VPAWTKLVGLGLQISIMLIVAAIGMHARWSDATYLFRRPALLLRSVVARNVIVPLGALGLATSFRLELPVRAAILAISVAAVPPIMPAGLLRAGGRNPYVIGLLVSQTLLAIVFVPITLRLFEAVFARETHFAGREVVPIVAKLTLAPLFAGMLVRRFWPASAGRVGAVLQKTGTGLLVLGVVGLAAVLWRPWAQLIGNGTLVALALLAGIGIAAGHLLGGPRDEDRTSLALAGPSSHPGLAIAILAANIAHAQSAIACVLLYLILQPLVEIPYKRRRRDEGSAYRSRAGLTAASPNRR
jgi:BASS family bile acid:Na+ symporter